MKIYLYFIPDLQTLTLTERYDFSSGIAAARLAESRWYGNTQAVARLNAIDLVLEEELDPKAANKSRKTMAEGIQVQVWRRIWRSLESVVRGFSFPYQSSSILTMVLS